jgi:hypothetical protein
MMNEEHEYALKIESLSSMLNGIEEKELFRLGLLKTYLIMAANVNRYFPSISPQEYFQFIKGTTSVSL